ncbi:RING-H2 finger protein ATL29-like [Magnolia sinica]|uniref:RING-H2 finger protein ATL29-like n=1 Tax=Magnolia sinica TaxID=86752 RepID=UPI002657F95D|nr:RING-H2 finger protein ATL29-like [Magnolia sinica]
MLPTDSVNHHPPESFNPLAEDDRRSLPIILTLILLVFFLLGFFSIYLCRYIMENLASLRPSPPSPRGLDPSIISSFPTFTYSSLKNLHHGNANLECAVCLSEFSDDDVLRQLTGCNHAFHSECIDLWFETQATCPICRRDLDRHEKPEEVSIPMTETDGRDEESHQHENSSKEEDGRGDGDDVELVVEQLLRSHSTGHSLVHREENGRFRLSDERRSPMGSRSSAILADMDARVGTVRVL